MKDNLDSMKSVYLEWEDSESLSSWKYVDELPIDVHICRSLGWIIKETKDVLVIASSVSSGGDQCTGAIGIPKRAITRRISVESPKTKARTRVN